MATSPDPVTPEVHNDLPAAALIERALHRGEGRLTATGALAVVNAHHTLRRPLDRFIVEEPSTADTIDWNDTNQAFSSRDFEGLWSRVGDYLAERDSYRSHLHVGQDPEHYLPIRLQTQTAWHSLFAQTLITRPAHYNPKAKEAWMVRHAAYFVCEPERDGTTHDRAIIINFAQRKVLLAGVQYAGELKKILFCVQSFLLPEKDILPLQCAATCDETGAATLLFGLSGAGKTTLSLATGQRLVGDDEHGWGRDAVFNLESGCYAKCANLNPHQSPRVWQAIRFGALLENVAVDEDTRQPDFANLSLTRNSRACFPLNHVAGHAPDPLPDYATADNAPHENAPDKNVSDKNVPDDDASDVDVPSYIAEAVPHTPVQVKSLILLTCDVSGVLPGVALLSQEAATYYFLSGYSARIIDGRIEDEDALQAVFSACFSAAFAARPVPDYIDLFRKRLRETGARVCMINTGWYGGPKDAGGSRYSLAVTRQLVAAAQQGDLVASQTCPLPELNLQIPARVAGIGPALLDPRRAWPELQRYQQAAARLSKTFEQNLAQLAASGVNVTPEIAEAGPPQTSSGSPQPL